MTRSGALLSLQGLDERIAGLRSEINAIERSLAGDDELARRRLRAEAATTARGEAESAAISAEHELAETRQRARQLERRLYDGSVRNPQDLLGMQREVEALNPRIDELETGLLERMQVSEAAEAESAAALAAVAERESEREARAEPRRQRLGLARRELGELLDSRVGAVAAIDAGDLRTYERIASRRTPAVVHLAADACGGCHLPLGIHEARQARQGDVIVQCSNCDRVVVS